MKVKLKEDISIKELSKNNWYGCRGDTMTFIELFYNTDSEQDVFVATKESDGFYKVITNDGEYAVTPNAFEIIEEDKEIEKLERINGSYLVDLRSDNSIEEQSEAITNLIIYLNNNVDKINELVKAVNELKKGK